MANVDFRQGRLETMPMDDASMDAVTSNCVINLVPDKSAVFREIRRVLRHLRPIPIRSGTLRLSASRLRSSAAHPQLG